MEKLSENASSPREERGSLQRAKQLISLCERFADNYKLFTEMNDALFVDCGAREWQELLLKRSETQRRILMENEEISKQSRELMRSPISSKEEADEILVYYRKIVNTGMVDYSLLDIVKRPLEEFYERTKDYLRLIGLNVTAGAIVLEYFDNMDHSLSPFSGKECCEKAIAYSKMVSPLEQPEVWISVLSAYANMIGSVSAYFPEVKKDFFRYYDEALSYFQDPVIGPAISALPNGPMFKDMIEGRVLFNLSACEELEPEERERFRQMIREEIQSPPAGYCSGEKSVLQNHIAYMIGDKDPKEAFSNMLQDYYALDKPDYTINDVFIKTEDYLVRCNLLHAMMDCLKDKVFSAEEKEEGVRKLKSLLVELAHSVPYGYLTSYVNRTSADMCELMLHLMDDEKTMKGLVNSLVILRQPITYIHSLMVREISVLIAEEILRKRPELLIPLFGDSKEEVRNRSREVLQFVSEAAMLHDIGKTRIADIINNQYRRITDLEYQYIKLHPSRGVEILGNLDCFRPYYDIMLGHHKTYDGKGGYPADFDNTASPYRIIIDLITIADCTDAATDILGRNYARGKTFYDLLSELSAGKNTRYNPDIVGLLEESDSLCDQLMHLTSENRHKIYYRAYRDIMNLNHQNPEE